MSRYPRKRLTSIDSLMRTLLRPAPRKRKQSPKRVRKSHSADVADDEDGDVAEAEAEAMTVKGITKLRPVAILRKPQAQATTTPPRRLPPKSLKVTNRVPARRPREAPRTKNA
jgi:hypothetical protein